MPQKVHDCATKLISEGKSESSAWAICNASIGGSNFVDYSVNGNGELFLKYFLADSSLAQNTAVGNFSLNGAAISSTAKDAVGLPFSILPTRDLSIFGDYHPWNPDENASWNDHVAFAKKYSPGHIVAVTPHSEIGAAQDVMNHDGRFAIVQITDQRAKDAYIKNPELIPKAVSPGVINLEAPNKTDIKNFKWTHLAAVPMGAYGDKATLYASCLGGNQCINHLLAAGVKQLDAKTNYCPIGASENLSSLVNSDASSSIMSDTANAVAATPPVAAQPSPSVASPAQTGALTTAPSQTTTQQPVLRLKNAGIPTVQAPKADPRLDVVEKKLAEIEQKEQFMQRLGQVRGLIDMRLFTVGGKYNQKEHDAAIEDATKTGWTDEQISKYYGGLLRIKEFEESQKVNPLGGSYYQTPSQVPEQVGAGTVDIVAQKTKGLFDMFHLEVR